MCIPFLTLVRLLFPEQETNVCPVSACGRPVPQGPDPLRGGVSGGGRGGFGGCGGPLSGRVPAGRRPGGEGPAEAAGAGEAEEGGAVKPGGAWKCGASVFVILVATLYLSQLQIDMNRQSDLMADFEQNII